jgi:type II secretory pathway pseudopilin PulG
MRERKRAHVGSGFTLIETMVAIVVLMVGVLGLAGMLAAALAYMQGSQDAFIAQQKAEEAVEAIYTATYDNTIGFAQVANTSANPPGIFLTGPQPLLQPAPNGLLGTLAGSGEPPAYILQPGPDGILGTADDVQYPLSQFARTITITSIEPNLQQVDVRIDYTSAGFTRSYDMKTMVSAF